MSAMNDDTPSPLPALPADTRGTPRAFHRWCEEDLERRRSRDVELDADRYARAVRLVLARLGTGTDSP